LWPLETSYCSYIKPSRQRRTGHSKKRRRGGERERKSGTLMVSSCMHKITMYNTASRELPFKKMTFKQSHLLSTFLGIKQLPTVAFKCLKGRQEGRKKGRKEEREGERERRKVA
jgi:hypothetical protein